MSEHEFDFLVVGAGSAGVRAARVAAGLGARVAVAESYRPGGTCVIRGCVPKKLLVYAAHYGEDFEDARSYGWTSSRQFSWSTLIANKDREIARLEDIYRTLLKSSGVTLLEGHARLLDAETVEVEHRRYRAANTLIASGGWPMLPDIPGIEHCITSNEALELAELPRRALVVGGGYIAVEFAGIFKGLGAEVVIGYRGEQILRGFDDDVRHHLHDELVHKGIDVRLQSHVRRIEKLDSGELEVALTTGSTEQTLRVDAVLYATGRRPNTRGLGLESAGVDLDQQGAVIVDAYSRSSVPNIFAAGDVTNRIALTPVAIREGAAVAQTLFGGVPTPVDHEAVAHAVFSQPPVGTVGLTETAALRAFPSVDVYMTSFRPLRYTLCGRNERTLIKLLVDSASQRVIGAHMVGPDAPEIIQGIAIAVKAGLTKQQFDQTVAVHPTAAEEFVTLTNKRTIKSETEA
jgi:glutathione reductase (NADPH)